MYLKSLFIAALVGSATMANAQTYDITEGYLRNSSFDAKLDYTAESAGNVEAVVESVPYGWSLYANAAVHKGVLTTVEYGSPVTICDVAVPAKGYADADKGGLAAFSVSSVGKYTLLQNVVLPPGSYKLISASYNTSSQTSVTSMLKWRAKKGSSSTSRFTFPENEWTTDTVSFTIANTTEGAIWAGYSSNKTQSTVIFLDWVKLYRDTPLGDADIAVKKLQITSLIEAANNDFGEDKGDAANVLKAKLAEAQALVDASDASISALNDMVLTVAEATESYKWQRDVVVTSDKRYARGATMAFGRMTVKGATAAQIARQGFAFAQSPNPTVADSVNDGTLNSNGVIYYKKNLIPGSKYYMRPFVESTTGAVAYGEQTMFYTIPMGQIKYNVRDGGTTEQYNRIKNATIEAVAYWNNLTSMKDVNINVGFQDGVPTADCSYGGWIRVGSNASYQATGTLLHEMLHGVGVIPWAGTQWAKFNLRSSSTNQNGGTYGSGTWLGDRATEIVQFWNNNTTGTLNGDYQHMWPFGINGAHEDNHSPELYIANSLAIQALAEDGLETCYKHHALPYYSKDVEDGVKYYIKAESNDRGRLTSYLKPLPTKGLRWIEMTAADAQLNDSVAWYISFNPANQYYQFTNVATGERIAYTSNGFRMSTTASASYDMQLMKGRVDVTANKLCGYWIIHPETDNWSPATLTANDNGTTGYTGLDLANGGTGLNQRWLILTAEELPLVDAETLGIDYAGVVASKPTATTGVYSINGTLVRSGNSVDGLPKGLYVVGGKKVVVK